VVKKEPFHPNDIAQYASSTLVGLLCQNMAEASIRSIGAQWEHKAEPNARPAAPEGRTSTAAMGSGSKSLEESILVQIRTPKELNSTEPAKLPRAYPI